MRREPELADRLLEVAVDLRLAGVRARPVVALERERVDVRVDVDLGAGVLVVPPGAADPLRLLVDRERLDAGLAEQHAGRDPAHPRADDRDGRRAVRSEEVDRPPLAHYKSPTSFAARFIHASDSLIVRSWAIPVPGTFERARLDR